jgi:hypothetical protein
MPVFETIIIYAIAIAAFYTLILWFIHKASVYFKKLDDAVAKSLHDIKDDGHIIENADENTSLTPKETVEYLVNHESVPNQIEVAGNK